MSKVVDFPRAERPTDLKPFKELVDHVVVISSVEFLPSSFGGGEYVRIRGTLENGTTFTTNTSARVILRQLKRLTPFFERGEEVRARVVRRRSARGTMYYAFEPP